MRINRLKKDHAHFSPEDWAKMISMMHTEIVQGFAIALLACLIILPLPLYLMHSFNYFEIQFLALDALVLISILAYNLIKIKNYRVDLLIGFIISIISFFTLVILLTFPVMMIMYSITGTFTVMPFNPMFLITISLLIALHVDNYVPENKKHWCICAGCLFCCIVVAVWSFLKLHGQG